MLTLTNEDNMVLMARYPDNHFDLAIVDPPYGININHNMGRRKGDKHSGHKKVTWDSEIPDQSYFNELFRVSKDQIIWGGNYFPLKNTGGWIFWDKYMSDDVSFSAGELAWTSFLTTLIKIDSKKYGIIKSDDEKIHPTQKPVKLYKYLLGKYATPGFKILDTHLGSGSHAIACRDLGFELTACEIDQEHYKDALHRIKMRSNINYKVEVNYIKTGQVDLFN